MNPSLTAIVAVARAATDDPSAASNLGTADFVYAAARFAADAATEARRASRHLETATSASRIDAMARETVRCRLSARLASTQADNAAAATRPVLAARYCLSAYNASVRAAIYRGQASTHV